MKSLSHYNTVCTAPSSHIVGIFTCRRYQKIYQQAITTSTDSPWRARRDEKGTTTQHEPAKTHLDR